MTPDDYIRLAESLLKQIEIPPGVQVVLVATDESGDFVGVTSNVPSFRTSDILTCAAVKNPDVTHFEFSLDPSKSS